MGAVRVASIAIVLSFVSIARAQDAGTAVPEAPPPPATIVLDDAEPDGPTPEQQALLEGTHITELAQETRVALRDTWPLLRDDEGVLLIANDLPSQEAEVARRTTPVHLAQIARMSQRELADHRRAWRAQRGLYESWQASLAQTAGEIEVARTTLVNLRRTWRALRDAAQTDPAGSDSRMERIATSVQQVRDAANALETQRDTVQALEDRVSDLIITSTDVIDDIRDALAAYRQRLFVRDRPPLWEGLGDDLVDEGDLPWGEHLRAQAALVGEHASAMFRLALAMALLAAAIAWLRGHVARVGGEEEKEALALTARPIAMALVLGLISSGFVVPNAPVSFGDAVAILIVLPTLWLIWPALPSSARGFVAIIALYAVIDRVEGTMNDGSLVRRGVVIAESIGFGVALAMWLRSARDATAAIAVRERVLAAVGATVLGLAALANVLGYSFLATVLVRGTAFAVGGALSLATALSICDALFTLTLGTAWLQRSFGVRLHRSLILSRLHRALVFGLSIAWFVLVLGGYGLATPFFTWLDETLHAHSTFGTFDLSIGEIVAASLVLGASWIVTRFVLFVLELDVLPRLPLEPGVGGAIAGLTRYVLFGLGLILSLATLGIDASQIALVAGALGVGVGFGLQGIVANFIAGLVLMIERPVRLGDQIEVGSLTGRVDRIGLRSSTVRGEDGAEVIVPNETLIGREVVNWTLSDRKRRVQIAVGVAYGTDPRRVLDLVRKAIHDHGGVLTTTSGGAEPVVEFTAFGASSLDFVIKFWTADEDHGNRLKSEVGILVLDALVAAGIEIPFPQQDVNVKSLPAQAAVKS